MEYPPEVQKRVDFLARYKINENLDTCHIIHLYAEGLAFPDGWCDSQFFTLVIYDTKKMEKREIVGCDGVNIETKKTHAKMVRIFADGSTMVKFDNVVKVGISQSVTVYEA